jgi:hypothetical protein
VNSQIDIKEGTVSFWINPNAVDFADSQMHPLAQVNPSGGSIFIIKDIDNKIKISYVVLNVGRIDLEYDVSPLNKSDKHQIALTWKLSDRLLLYIDGRMVAQKVLGVDVESNICFFNVVFPLAVNDKYFRVHAFKERVLVDVLVWNSEEGAWVYEIRNSEVKQQSDNFEFRREQDCYVYQIKTEGAPEYRVEMRENKLNVTRGGQSPLNRIQNNTISGSIVGIHLNNGSVAIGGSLPSPLSENLSEILRDG